MRQNMLNRLFCPAFGQYNVTIHVSDGKAYFADSECTELEALHGFSQDDVFYIYIGADQDTAGEKSRFTNFTIYMKMQRMRIEK